MVRKRVVFMGRVQGVGFRATARGVASGHPVSGWVRNQEDGSVLMEVQGEPRAVEACLEELEGLVRGLVKARQVDAIAVVEDEAGFEIRR